MKHVDPVMKELWAAKDANAARFPMVSDYLSYLRETEVRGRKTVQVVKQQDGRKARSKAVSSG